MKSLLDYKYAKVLVVGAHFDDETLFCGGTLRRLRDQQCELAIAVTASVTVTNQPRDLRENDSSRQQRRLVAFGRVCGMLDVSRVFMLDGHNCRQDESPGIRNLIESEIEERLAPVIAEVAPDVVLTHGQDGEYGHGQHILAHRVTKRIWPGPLWVFDAEGELKVSIDLAFKKRLLDCYRYGTTQDPYWAPYLANPATSEIGPWLGATEPFKQVAR